MTIDARGAATSSPVVKRRSASPAAAAGSSIIGILLAFVAVVSLFVVMSMGSGTTSGGATTPTPDAGANTPMTIADQVLADPAKMVALDETGRDQLASILKDPDSARYRNVVAVSPPRSKGAVAFCGLVNAKNGFGGYAGYTRFISVPNVGAWLRNSPGVRFSEVWRDFCQDRYVIAKAEFVN